MSADYPFLNIPTMTNTPVVNFQPATIQPPQRQIDKVNGREGANAFPMGPNSSVILADLNDPIVWVVVTDSAAYKTISPFSITPYKEDKPVMTSDLEAKFEALVTRMDTMESSITRIEERMNKYGQPNAKSNWNGKPNGGNATNNIDA